jgi:arylformamidase
MPSFETLHDISVSLGQVPAWPGDTPYTRRMRCTLAGGDVSDVSILELSAHAGTHVDSPAHFIAGAKKIDELPVDRFILPACVVECDDETCIRVADLAGADVAAGEALIFKTRNTAAGVCTDGTFHKQYVYLSDEAADWCAQRGVALVGIDAYSVDAPGTEEFPAHHTLMSAGICVLEILDLRAVQPGRYTLLCLPLKLPDCEASPVRAVLAREG